MTPDEITRLKKQHDEALCEFNKYTFPTPSMDSAKVEIACPQKWQKAVEDALIIAGIFGPKHSDPHVALADLLDYHVGVAIDPTVSSDAQALIDRGRASARRALLDWMLARGIPTGHGDTLSGLLEHLEAALNDARKEGRVQFTQRNLWHERDDGLWEWTGKQCPPNPMDGSVHYVRDSTRQSWVCVPTPDDPNEGVNEI